MSGWQPALAWLAEVLWPQGSGLRVVAGESPPPGFRVIRSYTVVPSLSRARFLLPADSPLAAVGALRSYNALRDPRTRWARSVLASAFRTRAGRSAFRHRLDVCVSAGVDEDAVVPEKHLEWALGEPVELAIGVGRQGPNRKPTLQVLSHEGRPLAYAKVGWNAFTKRLVRNEAEMLGVLSELPREMLVVPRLLRSEDWRDVRLTVSAPLPEGAVHFPIGDPYPRRALRELARAEADRRQPLETSTYLERLRSRLAESRDGLAALERVLLRWGGVAISPCTWHGDWVPWNLGVLPVREPRSGPFDHPIAAWDWEHGRSDVPQGFDALHWHFQVAFVAERTAAQEAWARCVDRCRTDLANDFGVLGEEARLTTALYLLELFARYEEAAAAGAGRNPRLYPAIRELVRDLPAAEA